MTYVYVTFSAKYRREPPLDFKLFGLGDDPAICTGLTRRVSPRRLREEDTPPFDHSRHVVDDEDPARERRVVPLDSGIPLGRDDSQRSGQELVAAAGSLEHLAISVDFRRPRERQLEIGRAEVGDTLVAHVFAVGDAFQQTEELERRHLFDQTDVEEPVVNRGFRRDQPAASDQARITDGKDRERGIGVSAVGCSHVRGHAARS